MQYSNPVDIGIYSSETFVCVAIYGIAFYKTLNFMSCIVMC